MKFIVKLYTIARIQHIYIKDLINFILQIHNIREFSAATSVNMLNMQACSIVREMDAYLPFGLWGREYTLLAFEFGFRLSVVNTLHEGGARGKELRKRRKRIVPTGILTQILRHVRATRRIQPLSLRLLKRLRHFHLRNSPHFLTQLVWSHRTILAEDASYVHSADLIDAFLDFTHFLVSDISLRRVSL